MRILTSDYFEFDDEYQILTGRSSGKKYAIGDKIKVILRECDVLTGSLTLQPIETKLKRKK